MENSKQFSLEQLSVIYQAVSVSEESVADYYKLSVNQWLRHRYDIKTAVDLGPAEIVKGPFAQVVRYEGKRNNVSLGSATYDFYKICLQDHSILSALETQPLLRLLPFSAYVVTHELVHIVRFSRFLVSFQANAEEKEAEEVKVHDETQCILSNIQIPGIELVFDFFKTMRQPFDDLTDF